MSFRSDRLDADVDDGDDDLFDGSSSSEISLLRELEQHPAYRLLCREILMRIENQTKFLLQTDPGNVGLVGRHQGVITALSSLLPQRESGTEGYRTDIIGEMLTERQEAIADRNRRKAKSGHA